MLVSSSWVYIIMDYNIMNVSKDIDVNETSLFEEHVICYYWYF